MGIRKLAVGTNYTDVLYKCLGQASKKCCNIISVGHREDLLAGAKRCLYERGYAHTTARDIVAASGTNLASIGYHFGSKEALLNAAIHEALAEWADELQRILAADTGGEPLERFEATWTRIIESFDRNRPLLVASFEALVQAMHNPELREQRATAQEYARFGLASLFARIDPGAVDEGTVTAVGSFYLALLTGVMSQWLMDPDNSPTGQDLAVALRTIVDSIRPETQPARKRA